MRVTAILACCIVLGAVNASAQTTAPPVEPPPTVTPPSAPQPQVQLPRGIVVTPNTPQLTLPPPTIRTGALEFVASAIDPDRTPMTTRTIRTGEMSFLASSVAPSLGSIVTREIRTGEVVFQAAR